MRFDYTQFKDKNNSITVNEYRRELDLEYGVSRVSYSIETVKFNREYFCSYPDNVMVLHLNSDKITVPKNNNELSGILFDSDDKKLGDYIKDENNFTNHINMRCSYPLQLHSSFDTGIFEKAVILEMQDRLRMIKEDITKSIKDGEK